LARASGPTGAANRDDFLEIVLVAWLRGVNADAAVARASSR